MNSDLKSSYENWLKRYGWMYFITLHFKERFTPTKEIAEQKVRHLCTRLNRYLNGTKPNSKLSVFAVFETSKGDVPHVHILLGAENMHNRSIDEIRKAVAYYWGKLSCCICPILMGEANSGWFTDTDDNKEHILGYMCKEFNIDRDPVLIGALKLPNTK